MPDITLALGGGGSKGFAHIGVLRVLEAHGFRVRAVAGTSAGAIIGSLYAAGYSPEQITELVESVPARAFQRKPNDKPSLMGLAGVEDMLRRALDERTFEDLPLPFGTVAVDVQKGRVVYLRHGPVVKAVLASSAVPGIFPPIEWDGRLLVDGGVMDNVPVRLARLLAPDVPVVAVSLTPTPDLLGDPTGVRMLARIPILNQLAGCGSPTSARRLPFSCSCTAGRAMRRSWSLSPAICPSGCGWRSVPLFRRQHPVGDSVGCRRSLRVALGWLTFNRRWTACAVGWPSCVSAIPGPIGRASIGSGSARGRAPSWFGACTIPARSRA